MGQEGGRAGLAFGLVEPAQRQGGRDAHQRIRECGHDVGPDATRRLEEGPARIGRRERIGPEREVARVRPVVLEGRPRAAGESVVGVASGEGERGGGQEHSGNGFPYQPLDKVTCAPSGVGRGRGTHASRAPGHRRWFRAPARADRRSAFPCLRLVRQSGEASCAGLRPARADRRSAFPCLRLVRQSGDASCAGLRPARADRMSAFPCLCLVRQSGDASCAGLRPARADRRSAFPCRCLVQAERRYVVRWPSARACRPEVGVPVPASREAERRRVVRWPVRHPRGRCSGRHRRSPGRSTKSNQLGPLPSGGSARAVAITRLEGTKYLAATRCTSAAVAASLASMRSGSTLQWFIA